MYSYTKINKKYYITDEDTNLVSSKFYNKVFDTLTGVRSYLTRLNKEVEDQKPKEPIERKPLTQVQKFRQ